MHCSLYYMLKRKHLNGNKWTIANLFYYTVFTRKQRGQDFNVSGFSFSCSIWPLLSQWSKSYRAVKVSRQSKNKCLPNYITDLDQKALAKILPFVDYTFKLHLSLTWLIAQLKGVDSCPGSHCCTKQTPLFSPPESLWSRQPSGSQWPDDSQS